MKKITFIFAMLLLFSCNHEIISPTSENSLNGKWNWISSSGGFAGHTITPESEKKTVIIEISNSSLKKYENGNLVFENTFTIKTQSSIFGGDRKMIVPNNDGMKQSFEIADGKLFLSEECADCYQSKYARIK
jgi:hypothetical protein